MRRRRSTIPFCDPVAAAKWRPATRHKNERGYGRWLTFLIRRGEDLTLPAAARVTPANVDAFVHDLQAQGVKLGTLRNRLFELLAVISSIAPGADWSWLRARQLAESTSQGFHRERAISRYRHRRRRL